MDKHWKDKWIRALRSGDFRQGKGVLRRGEEYCCLGVLCKIHPEVEWNRPGVGRTAHCATYGESRSVARLPYDLTRELDLEGDEVDSLIALNDQENASFDDIATYIEENL